MPLTLPQACRLTTNVGEYGLQVPLAPGVCAPAVCATDMSANSIPQTTAQIAIARCLIDNSDLPRQFSRTIRRNDGCSTERLCTVCRFRLYAGGAVHPVVHIHEHLHVTVLSSCRR